MISSFPHEVQKRPLQTLTILQSFINFLLILRRNDVSDHRRVFLAGSSDTGAGLLINLI